MASDTSSSSKLLLAAQMRSAPTCLLPFSLVWDYIQHRLGSHQVHGTVRYLGRERERERERVR